MSPCGLLSGSGLGEGGLEAIGPCSPFAVKISQEKDAPLDFIFAGLPLPTYGIRYCFLRTSTRISKVNFTRSDDGLSTKCFGDSRD